MQVRERRGVSQVVFNFLPDQTVDMRGGVWRVTRWVDARVLPVDSEVVRREILKSITPWSVAGLDNGLAETLRRGMNVSVVTPSEDGAVMLEPFPELFQCRACSRIASSSSRPCKCGETRWRQLAFVAYHKCGRLDTPWVARCKSHDDVKLDLPKGRSIREIRHVCPTDGEEIVRGLPQPKCQCGAGPMEVNIHRLSAVYTPRTAVIVNPPDEAVAAQLKGTAAGHRTLEWVLGGMAEASALSGKPTVESLAQVFVEQGINEAQAREMAKAAAARSPEEMGADPARVDLGDEQLEQATEESLSLAYATSSRRTRLDDLIAIAEPLPKARYEQVYRPAVKGAGCIGIDLLEDFPVLTACYGYSRGDHQAGATSLRWFQTGNRQPRIHGQLSRTEGLLFRLDPLVVGRWLKRRGHLNDSGNDPRDVRLAILRQASIPFAGEEVEHPTMGSELLALVHSFSHRVMRRVASLAGIDQDALAEFLVPRHLAFIIYATTRGDFVLGGLQAMFEHDLHLAMAEVVGGESRCPLDPACRHESGACVACLHVGEPSCRYFNQYLGRQALFGSDGYFTLAGTP